MEIAPQLFTAHVMHKRLFPEVNRFTYGVYYLVLPLPALPVPGRFTCFDAADLGYRDGSDPSAYAKDILVKYGLDKVTRHIMLVTMPRVLGYVFNPVSFYLCLDTSGGLRAAIAEVHNTFGEQHAYLCAHAGHDPVGADDWLEAEKLFHVSPFLKREGKYRFRFCLKEKKLGIWIDYYDREKNRQLLTALTGNLQPLTGQSLRKAFWSHPLVTLKTILLIHWQAVKLAAKRIRYIGKPEQYEQKTSAASGLANTQGSGRPDSGRHTHI